MKILDRRLIRNLKSSRVQMLAIGAVIVMGLVTFAALTTTANNMSTSLNEYYHEQRFADLQLEFAWTSPGILEALRRIPGVAEIEGRAVVETRSPIDEDHQPTLRLVGNPRNPGINIPYLTEGRLPSRSREIALLGSFAEANDLHPGDSLPLIFAGEIVDFTVVGLAQSPEFILAVRDLRAMMPDNLRFGVGFVPRADLQRLVGRSGRINGATVIADPATDPGDLKERIQESLAGWGLRSVQTREDQLSHIFVQMELDGMEQMSRLIPVAFLGIAALIIYMMISRMIQDDRASIGILKATGYTNGEILLHYLKHALLLGSVGAIIGLGMGQLLSVPLSGFYMTFFHIPQLQTDAYPAFLFSGLFLTMTFCGATGLLATRAILEIAPAEALRPPAPTPGHKNLIEIISPDLWRRISFTWRTVLRYAVRGKRRFLLATGGIAMTFTIVLMPMYFYAVTMLIFVEQYDRLEVYDYAVAFNTPLQSGEILEELRDVKADRIEPFAEYPMTVRRGWKEEGLLARGLPRRSELYRFERPTGDTVEIPSRGILISEYVAEDLGVKDGDHVRLTSPTFPDLDRDVEVRAVIAQYLGSGLYCSTEEMFRLLGEGPGYNGALIGSVDDVTGILGGKEGIATIHSTDDLVDGFMQYMDLFLVELIVMIGVGGVLGFAILFNTISTSVTERRREIASLRVLGYSREEVFDLLVKENSLAVIVGLIAGVPIAHALIYLMGYYFNSELFVLPLIITPASYALAFLFTVIFAVATLYAIRIRVWSMGFLEALTSRIS
ncbi:MAG: ABC transporter permease [Bacillota bacterium]